MIRTPIENILGLKALAWDYEKGSFISPARPEFVWSPGGLQASVCGRGNTHRVPDRNCTCGLYAAYDLGIINHYTGTSPVSPIFLVEASGHTVIHSAGWRSAEMTVHMVAIPEGSVGTIKLAARQAADYFQIDVVEMSTMIIMMDVFNSVQLPYYRAHAPELQHYTRAQITEIWSSYVNT